MICPTLPAKFLASMTRPGILLVFDLETLTLGSRSFGDWSCAGLQPLVTIFWGDTHYTILNTALRKAVLYITYACPSVNCLNNCWLSHVLNYFNVVLLYCIVTFSMSLFRNCIVAIFWKMKKLYKFLLFFFHFNKLFLTHCIVILIQ